METEILNYVNAQSIDDSRKFAKERGANHLDVIGVLKSLASEDILQLNQKEEKGWVLTEEGRTFAENGKTSSWKYLNVF